MSQQHKLGTHATTVATQNGFTRITYQGTVVVAFDDSEIWLDSGGWRTSTTKTRMNQASSQFDLGFRVYQHGGAWFVSFAITDIHHKEDIAFNDNMRLAR